ncbi:MAG: HlyD family efflux transporter periplasmic adaptor subunit [Thermoguttaceae bacterium]|nr:HlyD family efflux transporter periplasmic adaptor subunit [Thermoguttaceae bacterium]
MSAQQSFTPDMVEKTKQHIKELVGEITELSRSDMPEAEFYAQFLQRVVAAVAAVGGVVWKIGETGTLALQCQVNIRETGLTELEKDKMTEHSRLLYKSLKHPEGLSTAPYTSSEEENGMTGNPTGCIVLLQPLITEVETVGLVEIFQRPEVTENTLGGYRRFLRQMGDLAVEFLRTGQLKNLADRQLLWNRVEEFVKTIHESLDPYQTAYTIANEGRRLIECDRVSVAIRRGSKCKVEAVSGQDLFDKRSNMIRLLNKLATSVVSVEEPLWYSGDTTNLAPQVEKIVDAYVDESHSKAVVVIPLIEPLREEDKEDFKKRQDNKKKPIGALIVEQIENSALQSTLRQRVDLVEKHACVALANSLEHNSLFLMPLWRAIGRWSWVVKARTLPKTILVVLLLAALLVGCFVFPYKFEVESDGKLLPVNRAEIFAQMDGDITSVEVSHGSIVQPGTPLATLRNIDFEAQVTKLKGDMVRTASERSSKTALLRKTTDKMEQSRLAGEIQELSVQLDYYAREMALLQQKQQDLVVKSQIAGIVVTFDVKEKLENRPVQRGQVLMEVADPTGDWEVELYMPENRIGLVREAQKNLVKEFPDGDLRVTFILASQPDKKIKGRIVEIHKTAEVREEMGNTVLVRVAFDKSQVPNPNMGASVTGKIYCGERSIGYVWFYDLIAFIQQKVLFRWF